MSNYMCVSMCFKIYNQIHKILKSFALMIHGKLTAYAFPGKLINTGIFLYFCFCLKSIHNYIQLKYN